MAPLNLETGINKVKDIKPEEADIATQERHMIEMGDVKREVVDMSDAETMRLQRASLLKLSDELEKKIAEFDALMADKTKTLNAQQLATHGQLRALLLQVRDKLQESGAGTVFTNSDAEWWINSKMQGVNEWLSQHPWGRAVGIAGIAAAGLTVAWGVKKVVWDWPRKALGFGKKEAAPAAPAATAGAPAEQKKGSSWWSFLKGGLFFGGAAAGGAAAYAYRNEISKAADDNAPWLKEAWNKLWGTTEKMDNFEMKAGENQKRSVEADEIVLINDVELVAARIVDGCTVSRLNNVITFASTALTAGKTINVKVQKKGATAFKEYEVKVK